MSSLPVRLMSGTPKSFIESLRYHGTPHYRRFQLAEVPAASVILEVYSNVKDAVPWGALAAVIVVWIKTRAGRQAEIKLRDGTSFKFVNTSTTEISRMMNDAVELQISSPPDDE